jgi:hypothetical protein
MDYSKLTVTHYPISEFDKFKDQVFQECAELAKEDDNWSDDESKSNSLGYIAKNRLDYFTISTYDGKFINFSGIYRHYNWAMGSVRSFAARRHGVNVLQSMWVGQVWPSQYLLAKEKYPNCKGYMVTFNNYRSVKVIQQYFTRKSDDIPAKEFYKNYYKTEQKIIQNSLQYAMSFKF